MQKFFVLVAFLGLLALPLMAQDNPKVEVFGGYQYEHIGNILNTGIDVNANGWDGALSYFFSKNLGVTGDFSGVYKSEDGGTAHIYTYSGGPVFALREGKINPFVHALFGGSNLCGCLSEGKVSVNGFTMMMGGGVDYKVNKRISIRLGQFDWVYYRGSYAGFTKSFSDNVRISTGVVFKF